MLTGRHLAIVGPTCAGKSRIAMEVALSAAERGPAPYEIVSVDSMSVYKLMDIGTDKPSLADRRVVAHHMLDFVWPWEEYSVSLFQAQARAALADIEARGRRALLVGGTGLYVRAVIDGFNLPGRFPELAALLEEECREVGPEKLHRRLASVDPVSASRMEPNNARRIVRALEVTAGSGRLFSSYGPGLTQYPDVPFAMWGVDRPDLDDRIELRVSAQIEQGFLGEVRTLVSSGRSLSRTAAQGLGYRELSSHLRGGCDLANSVSETIRRTRLFARRQRRWFRRDPRITWLDGREPAAAAAAILVR